MEKEWAGTTYGNNFMHKWLICALRYIDVRLLYIFIAIFVIPICLLINPSRKTAYYYFRNRLGYGKWKAAWNTYVNHFLFGQVVIDKFAMYAGKRFKVEIEGYEHFTTLSKRKEGFLQLSSHIGNYEIAGYSLVSKDKKINALVYFGEKESVMSNRNKMFNVTNINMISVSPDYSHLFAIDAALVNNEIVSMPADRLVGSKKHINCNFLGAEASFPMGPFSVATMRGLNVLAVNVIKCSAKRYKIIVTPLHYDKEVSRKVQIQQLATEYVAELERILKIYPTQWYNFYKFW